MNLTYFDFLIYVSFIKVYELGWNPKRAPPLDKLVSLCRKLNNFLKQNKKNVVVVHCLVSVSAAFRSQVFILYDYSLLCNCMYHKLKKAVCVIKYEGKLIIHCG